MTIEQFFKEFETRVDEGERQLNTPFVRKQLEVSLSAILPTPSDGLSPRQLMIEAMMAMLSRLPDELRLKEFDAAVGLLKPLKEVKEISCREDFDRIVLVRERFVITETRMPLVRFLNGLREYLARDKSTEKRFGDQRSDNRRIRGFAPPPHHDDERK